MTPSPSLLGPDLRGRVLCDRFRLDAIVGCSGTANVYDALDLRLRRCVAVKVVHPEHARSEAQRLRVRQEAVLAGILDHPHDRAHRTADAAARLNWAWSPLKLLMSLLPAEESGEINARDDR